MRVLVVDDSATMRRIIKGNLKVAGYDDVLEAENGKVALDRVHKGLVDLIITDWNMPEMTGLELAAAVRQQAAARRIPILMVTTMGEKGEILAALKAGVTNYLVKPFTPEGLRQKIEESVAAAGR